MNWERRRRRMTFYIPLFLMWDPTSPSQLSQQDSSKLIFYIKQICEESAKSKGYHQIDFKSSFLLDGKYVFVCHPDPSYSAIDIIDLFDIFKKKERWFVLDPYSREPTRRISYYIGINPHYRQPFLEFKYHSKIQELLVKSCKDLNSYLFSWDEIPGNDNERLIEFLKFSFGIDWVKPENIGKIDDKTIVVSTEKNSLSLRLDDEKTTANLKIDDCKTDKFSVKTENGKLKIYKNIYYIDCIIYPREVGLFASIPIERPLNEFARGIKSRMTFYIRREIPEIFEKYREYKIEPLDEKRPQFWTSGTYFSISSKKPPKSPVIQYKLDEFIEHKFEQISYQPNRGIIQQKIEEIIKERESKGLDGIIQIFPITYLIFKIQQEKTRIDNLYYRKYGKHLFEFTPSTEGYANYWQFVQTISKLEFDEFLRETHSYIIESSKNPDIINKKDFPQMKVINALRIVDASGHDISMSYDKHTNENRELALNFYQKKLRKILPDTENDFKIAQEEILMLIIELLPQIEKKYLQ